MLMQAMVGSLREDSYNLMLINTMKERYQELFEIEILDIGSLPHFNQDRENNPPEIVVAFKKQIFTATGVLIATPEYNWSVPGVLKNALDWLSRGEKVLVNKPVLCMGATTGMVGTVRAQIHLRQILSSPGLSCTMLPPGGNEILIPFFDKKINDAKLLCDEPTLSFLDGVVQKFVQMVSVAAE